jgi:hypothetical protein
MRCFKTFWLACFNKFFAEKNSLSPFKFFFQVATKKDLKYLRNNADFKNIFFFSFHENCLRIVLQILLAIFLARKKTFNCKKAFF